MPMRCMGSRWNKLLEPPPPPPPLYITHDYLKLFHLNISTSCLIIVIHTR